MEITKIELLEQRLIALEETHQTQTKVLSDLMEYLVRVDPNFKTNPGNFDDWHQRLEILRQEDRVQREVQRAKEVLALQGYLVVADESEIDAAKLKKWLNKG